MNFEKIIENLPYSSPFLFVDELLHIDEHGAKGCFTFDASLDFYKGHFKENPVTPGAILTECCAQIGVVTLGLYLLSKQSIKIEDSEIGLSSSEMEFYEAVFPNEKVTVVSEKEYFRFNKLKCRVKMYNQAKKLVCKGVISGMLKSR